MVYKIEKYGNRYKLLVYKTSVSSSRPFDVREFLTDDLNTLGDKSECKRSCNVSRAKTRVLELALCNEWEYFVTLTISADKQDRYCLKEYIKALGNWVANYNKKYNCKLKYLLVPECHKDGAWHLHGLFNGISLESLVVNSYGYYDMPYYANRFGFISIDKIQNKERCATYISKYIVKQYKETLINDIDLGKHLFYATKGLNGKQLIESGFVGGDILKIDTIWQNDYIGLSWANSMEELEILINERGSKNEY